MDSDSLSIQQTGGQARPDEIEHHRVSGAEFELKLVAERWRAQPVLCWLRHVCRSDPAFPESTIFTVYYDTPALDCLLEKRNSDYLKTKVRLRWYLVGDHFADTAFLEVKSRIGSRREKRRVTLRFQPAWPTHGALDVPSLRGVPRLLRPAGIFVPEDYRPVLLVRYRRHRFIEPHTGSRTNLDTSICAPAVSRAGRLTPSSHPLRETVFECKGQLDHLPASLQGLTRVGFRKASFSKYAACYDHALASLG